MALAPVVCAALALSVATPAVHATTGNLHQIHPLDRAASIEPARTTAEVSPELTDALGTAASSPFRTALDTPIGVPAAEVPGQTPAGPPAGQGDADTPADDEDTGEPPTEDWIDDRTGRVEVLVYFTDPGVAPSAQGDPELAAAALQQDADTHWNSIDRELATLTAPGDIEILNRFWVTNAVLVSAAPSARVLTQLAALPGAIEVTPNFTVAPLDDIAPPEGTLPTETTPDPTVASEAETAAAAAEAETAAIAAAEVPVTYGIEKIAADDVWRDFGARGQGVRVAVLDTGVDATHPDIGARLVGRGTGDPTYPGGWINFDRTGKPLVTKPTDPGSHGTHVAGTVLGGSASGTSIGVAPDAELMAANVLSGGGSAAKILAALEWVMAPTDGTGAPAGRPADVINMSLGSSGFEPDLARAIRNVRDAGIFPAVAIGNKAGTTSAPGNYFDAVAVGMTNAEDLVDPQSSGGVVAWDREITREFGWPDSYVKPDISAPGVKVFSAMPGGKFGESSGTSMATPHVAGAVALIRSAQAGLSVTEIEDALKRTAWHPDPAAGADIGYGSGRIDVHAALSELRGESGVTGTVVNASTGAPIASATVSYGDRGETWTTDAQGRFTARLGPGSYTLTAERFGFETAQSATVTVAATGFTKLSLPLTPITVGTLSGTVVDHASSAPVAGAAVSIAGIELTTTTDARGAFRFDAMPVGEYRVRVAAEGKAEAISAAAPVRAALTTTVSFRLANLSRVLVLGDSGGSTAALLADNGFVAESRANVPEDLTELGTYDAVLWDAPAGTVSRAQIDAAIAATDASGSGIIWLDLGDSESSGIAALQRTLGNPASRDAAGDRSASAVGYRVTADHEILAGGLLSPEAFGVGSVIVQNSATAGTKWAAWFDGLRGTAPTVIAETVMQVTDASVDPQVTTTTALGTGLAVDQRATNRHAYLALHGTSSAIDARNWSPGGVQLLLNTVRWTAPAATQAPEPVIGFPVPPVVTPPVVKPPVVVTPPVDPPVTRPVTTPRPTPSMPVLQPAGTPEASQTASSGTGAARAPGSQAAPKPETKPEPPVASARDLTRANAGGVTVRVSEGIAYISIPQAKPGDWYFLHVYPQATAIDWIRANSDSELRVDISRLTGGKYQFAFTAADNSFAGWVEVVIPATAKSAAPAGLVDEDPTQLSGLVPGPVDAGGFQLSVAEQLMLLGSALLILAAAGVVLFGPRKRVEVAAPPALAPTA